MAGQVKFSFAALTAGSALALMSVNTNTRTYATDGKIIEGVTGDPRLEVCVMDTLDRYSVTAKTVDVAIASMIDEQIIQSLKNRQYIYIELENAYASPYVPRSGFGVAYSVKADAARIASAQTQAPAMSGFGKPPKAAE